MLVGCPVNRVGENLLVAALKGARFPHGFAMGSFNNVSNVGAKSSDSNQDRTTRAPNFWVATGGLSG